RPACAGASVLVTGANFGCGSSREHAPQSLVRAGFRAVVAGSFAEIFFGNATNIGLACVRLAPDDLADLTARVQADPTLPVTVDLEAMRVEAGDRGYAAAMPDSARTALITGTYDPLAELLEGLPQVRAAALALGHEVPPCPRAAGRSSPCCPGTSSAPRSSRRRSRPSRPWPRASASTSSTAACRSAAARSRSTAPPSPTRHARPSRRPTPACSAPSAGPAATR